MYELRTLGASRRQECRNVEFFYPARWWTRQKEIQPTFHGLNVGNVSIGAQKSITATCLMKSKVFGKTDVWNVFLHVKILWNSDMSSTSSHGKPFHYFFMLA